MSGLPLAGPQKRYIAHAGFVTTPRYFDDSPQQFLEVSPKGMGVIQRVLHIPAYDYRLDQRAKNFDLLEEAAVCLGESHAQVIGQVGSNWVHCTGTTPDDIRRICDRISEKAGARFLMAGMCIVDALEALGAKKITVANGYYRRDWMAGINGFLEQAGFEILSAGNVIDQGLYDSLDEQLEVERLTLWDYPTKDVVQACHLAHLAAPEADAVVQTGAGFRIAPHIDEIEGLVGKPVVPSDMALYWAMLRHLDLGIPVRGHGHLMGTLVPTFRTE
jgi:maleate cis-trans isomerase